MSRASDAAERVEEFLRQHAARTASPDVVLVEYAENEVLGLRTDDLALLVECAQWLLMASNAELKREYATTTASQGFEGNHLHPEELVIVQRAVSEWNSSKQRREADEAMIASRLVSPWERRA